MKDWKDHISKKKQRWDDLIFLAIILALVTVVHTMSYREEVAAQATTTTNRSR